MTPHRTTWPLVFALASLLAAGCSTGPETEDDPEVSDQETLESPDDARPDSTDDGDYSVEFRDRTIDLHPYVQGFPYSSISPELEHGFMVYFETDPEGKWLKHLSLDTDDVDLTDGRRIHDIDWSTRNFRRGTFNPVLDEYVFLADEQNQEVFNVYSLNLEDGSITRRTDADYVYGYGFSDDDRLMGYVVRHGESEPFDSCLHVRDLVSGDDTELWCDDGGDDRLTWTGIDFADDDGSLIVRMQHDGDRNKTNIGRFDVDEPGDPELLLERGVEHLRLSPISDTYDGDELLYVSAKTGINDVYRYDLRDGSSRKLTELEDDIASAALLEADETPARLLMMLDRPYGTIVQLRDPETGDLIWSAERDESVRIRDDHGAEAMLTASSVETPFRMERARLGAIPEVDLSEQEGEADEQEVLRTDHVASLPDELTDEIIHCDVQRIEYPTFDDVDGERRLIHAYLYEPTDPPASDDERIARITAFYGGSNAFRTGNQIMCEAGITTLSPAPRGSRGFGAEFAALNDGDLGGDDIVDIFYAARWLEQHRDFQPRQIGVRGASHGGYATMRALTFPPETNDRDEFYPFGFGHSHAGVSDLLHFYETSNIPDWLVLLAGDPDEDADRLRDRSPLTHVDRLDSPLLLTHGANDSRVPPDESRRFADAADDRDLPVTYEEFDGQGHGIDGLDNRLRYYRAIFEFLEDDVVPRLDPSPSAGE